MKKINHGLACKLCADLLTIGLNADEIRKVLIDEHGYRPRGGVLSAPTINTMASKWLNGYFNDNGEPSKKYIDSKLRHAQKLKDKITNYRAKLDVGAITQNAASKKIELIKELLKMKIDDEQKLLLVEKLLT